MDQTERPTMSQDPQSGSEPDYTTVEQSVEYHPEVIGGAELVAGEPEQTFPEYGLELVPVLMDGGDTGRRLIRRNGNYIADVSNQYTLVPNEDVVHAANDIAEQLGAVPFHEFSGDWYVQLDDHVIQDNGGRRVHALYAWDDPVEFGDDDSVQFGFAIHNSIDGSLALNVGLFTFRHACSNMVWMGVNGSGMSFDDREVVAHHSHKHTSGISNTVDELRQTVENTLLLVDTVEETYRAWRDQFISVDDVRGIIDRLPSKDLPEWMQEIEDHLDDARENEELDGEDYLSDERAERIVRDEMPATETRWELYNDITENVWHDENTSDTTKDRKFTKLHRVLEPAEGVR